MMRSAYHRWTEDELREIEHLRKTMSVAKLALRFRVTRMAMEGVIRRMQESRRKRAKVATDD